MPSQVDERDAFLNYLFNGMPHTPCAVWYVGLLTVPPSGAPGDQGTEVVGNNYARQLVTFSLASGGSLTNVGDIDFPAAIPAGWGDIYAFGLYDDPAAGDLHFYKEITPFTVTANMLVKILDGDLDVLGV